MALPLPAIQLMARMVDVVHFSTYDKAVEAAHDLKITSTATLVGIDGTGQTSSDTITSTVR